MVDALSEERQLYQRLLARDITVLAEIYSQFSGTVFAVAYRVTADLQAAEDVTQETLLDLWRRPECFNPTRGGLRPWLAACAHNRSIDWIRHERAARHRNRYDLTVLYEVDDVDGDVQARMTAERVRDALSALPESELAPIRLAFFHDRSYRQVAADLGVAEGTIKSRIKSGLRHLSQLMRAERVA